MRINYVLIFLLFCACSNVRKNQVMSKTFCYSQELQKIIQLPEYNSVRASIIDTFEILKKDIQNFGSPVYFDCKLDQAAFFNSNLDKCILLVSIRDKTERNVFGSTRILRGEKSENGWDFSVGLTIRHDKNYFDVFPSNDFSSIEKLGRYVVLTNGNPQLTGCQLDESYWFKRVK